MMVHAIFVVVKTHGFLGPDFGNAYAFPRKQKCLLFEGSSETKLAAVKKVRDGKLPEGS
jgi:hypothetical protein